MVSPELASNTDPVSFVPGRDPKLLADKTTSDGGPKAERDRPHLLWIDDELNPSDAIVRLLELQGFRIRCTQTGTEGLALARGVDYQAILLDLRLPDVSGLSVLANLRADRMQTPVVVITGFPDTESALVAGRLGAGAYHWKLDSVEELSATIHRLIRRPESATPGAPSPSGDLGPNLQTASLSALAALLEALDRFTQPSVEAAARPENSVMIREALTQPLLRALLESSLPPALFLACASAFKLVIEADANESPFRLAERAQSMILKTLSRQTPRDSRVVVALTMLESAATAQRRLKEKDLSDRLPERIDPSHLGRLVGNETGFGLMDWRTGLLLRPCLIALAETDEQIKQVARRRLGFKHEPQFTAEFHRFFGLTPTEFRQHSRPTRWDSRRRFY